MGNTNTRCSEMLKKIFDLKNTDIETYKYVLSMGEVRADELANKVGKDRTTVYRSLEKLVRCGLCQKKKMILKGGGKYYLYMYKEPQMVKKLLEHCIENWYSSMKETLRELEKHISELDF